MNPRDLFDLPFEDDSGGDRTPATPRRRILTVSELTAGIRRAVESAFDEV